VLDALLPWRKPDEPETPTARLRAEQDGKYGNEWELYRGSRFALSMEELVGQRGTIQGGCRIFARSVYCDVGSLA
jgi:hypothetical protein